MLPVCKMEDCPRRKHCARTFRTMYIYNRTDTMLTNLKNIEMKLKVV